MNMNREPHNGEVILVKLITRSKTTSGWSDANGRITCGTFYNNSFGVEDGSWVELEHGWVLIEQTYADEITVEDWVGFDLGQPTP